MFIASKRVQPSRIQHPLAVVHRAKLACDIVVAAISFDHEEKENEDQHVDHIKDAHLQEGNRPSRAGVE